ncbi:MAG: hypothetical protein ABSG68_24970 [Thermoguttaceae bacterium]|jgi:flagellar M-ring protein FliF
MDFLNRAYAQLSELFRSMTPGARITSALLLAGVVISLGYLFHGQISGPDDYLMNGEPISANDLANMEMAFGKANLNTYQVEGAKIRVPKAQKAAYMAALAEAKALPANFGSAIRAALDAGSPIDSKQVRDERIKNAVQEELSLIIRSMKGIENASVLYDTETKSGLSQEKVARASVAVKPLGSEPLDDRRVSCIRDLLCGAIAGLKPENVTVADIVNGTAHRFSPDGSGENLYVAVKEMWERDLRAKILSSLSFIPNLSVETSVVLDPDSHTRTSSLEYKKPVAYQVEDKSSTKSREGGSGGRVGAASQQANSPIALAGGGASKGPREEEETSDRHESSVVPMERMEKEKVGLTPKLAKAAVGIPISYFEKVWRNQNPLKDGESPKAPDQAALDKIRTEESAKLQKNVAALLPPSEGVTDPAELVTITTFQDIKPAEVPTAAAGQKVLVWLGQNWNTLGIAGLALVSLVMLRSMIRSAPAAPEPASTPLRLATPESDAQSNEPPEVTAARRLKRSVSGGGPSLRDELSELVKENPDAAANILRTWIGNAG